MLWPQVDESFMLPVLTRLNGRPEVTTDGNIIYLFPDLMTSAGRFIADRVLVFVECVSWATIVTLADSVHCV